MTENQPTPIPPLSPSHPSGIPGPDRQWGMFAHLSAFSGILIPFGSIIGPLAMYLIKKDEYQFGTNEAKEALNFNIACAIYFVISFILMFVIIGFFLMIGLGIFWLIVTIIAAMKANEGVAYRYPLCIRFIS